MRRVIKQGTKRGRKARKAKHILEHLEWLKYDSYKESDTGDELCVDRFGFVPSPQASATMFLPMPMALNFEFLGTFWGMGRKRGVNKCQIFELLVAVQICKRVKPEKVGSMSRISRAFLEDLRTSLQGHLITEPENLGTR